MPSPTRHSLSKILLGEAREVGVTRARLGVAVTLAEVASNSLLQVADHVGTPGRAHTTLSLNKSIAAAFFLRAAARTHALEFLDIARRHWPESILKRRRTHELIAFAWIAIRDRAAAYRWIKQRQDWNRYYSTFSPTRVPTALEDLAPGETERHRKLQRIAHPSLASLAPSTGHRRLVGTPSMSVPIFDDSRYVPVRLVQAIKVERTLDSVYQLSNLLAGLLRRLATREPWATGIVKARTPVDQLRWRVGRDRAHYAAELHRLDAYRTRMNARLSEQGARSRKRNAQLSALLGEFFERGTSDEFLPPE